MRALKAERARIRRAFAAALIAAGPVSFVGIACETAPSESTGPLDSGNDAIESAATDTAIDASGVACQISVTTFDSGIYLDAEGGAIDIGCIYNLPCGLPPTVVAIGCQVYTPDPQADAYYPLNCTISEGLGCQDGSFTAVDGGLIGLICNDCLGGGGRRPRGLKRAHFSAENGLGLYFSKMAHEEAASIQAFVRMEAELAHFGAPSALRRAAGRAANDERRHARIMRALATKNGSHAPNAHVTTYEPRSLEAMAIENAVEGCVNETFGALILRWQAAHAADPSLRKIFARIAIDEERHAALSWAVAAWAESRLDARASARLRKARERAAGRCALRTKRLENGRFARFVGRPNSDTRARLASALLDAMGSSA